MNKPRVSVIMPLYNTISFVAEAMDSILSQTFKDFELIVVDNGSDDGSREYATSVIDDRVRVITAAVRGPGAATNAGIAASKTDLLAVMDSDDIAHHDRLRLQIEFMDAHPEVVLLGTRFAFRVGTETVPVPPQPREHDQIRRALMDGRPVICNPSTMARAGAAKSINGHRLPGPGADFDFFLRMSDVGKLHNLPTLLHYYRLHDQSTSIVRMMDTNREQSYGFECAVARQKALNEPDSDEFKTRWSQRSFLERAREYADCKSLDLYRQAIQNRAQRQWLRSAATMAHAALLSPQRTAWHLKRSLGLC